MLAANERHFKGARDTPEACPHRQGRYEKDR
jgi:hypothetical protein